MQCLGAQDNANNSKQRKLVTVDTNAALKNGPNDPGPPSAVFDTPVASKARKLTGDLESVLARNAAKVEAIEEQ